MLKKHTQIELKKRIERGDKWTNIDSKFCCLLFYSSHCTICKSTTSFKAFDPSQPPHTNMWFPIYKESREKRSLTGRERNLSFIFSNFFYYIFFANQCHAVPISIAGTLSREYWITPTHCFSVENPQKITLLRQIPAFLSNAQMLKQTPNI